MPTADRTVSQLTEWQRLCRGSARVDLAIGYPQFLASESRRSRVQRSLCDSNSLTMSPVEVMADIANILQLPPTLNGILTMSGSLAIARALQGIAQPGRPFVIAAPTFDVLATLASEASRCEAVFVYRDPFEDDDWIERVAIAASADVSGMILVSPDNPAGWVCSDEALKRLAAACARNEVPLIADQCFKLIDPFGPTGLWVSAIDGACDWCLLWDSSKTVELTGERVGLVLASESLNDRVSESFGVVQLEVPLTSAVSVWHELKVLATSSELAARNDVVLQNYNFLSAVASDLGLRTNSPAGGSFGLLDLTGSVFEDRSYDLARRLLRDYGIAVVPSDLCYPRAAGLLRDGPKASFLRISLARPPGLLTALAEALASVALTK